MVAVLLCGCTATLSVVSDRPTGPSPEAQQVASITKELTAFGQALAATPRDIEAVEAVLNKYGLKLKD